MPYTPAHTVLAAPIWIVSGRRIPLSALVVGCVAPDLPYLVSLAPVHAPGHTAVGLLTHSLPWGVFALTIWHSWLEQPMLELFGIGKQRSSLTSGWLLLALIGILIGATTHALVDATSHSSGWFVQRYEWFAIHAWGLPVFKWIQYGGGVTGMLVVLYWIFRAGAASVAAGVNRKFVAIALVVHALTITAFIVAANMIHHSHDLQSFAVHSATGAMSGAVIGACVYAIIIRSKFCRSTVV